MGLLINNDPSEEDVLKIRRKLQEYNLKYFEIKDEPSFTITDTDEKGDLIGGIACTIVGQWLEIDFLWVSDEQRGKGLGSKLLREAERHAMENDCTMSFLTTMSFQAQPFYQRYGYKTVYVQKGYPIINEKYFMEKQLN